MPPPTRSRCEAVLLTSVAFWVAHVYAGVLSRRLAAPERPLSEQAIASVGEEWPVIQSAGAPSVVLAIAGFGGLGGSTGVALALGVGLVQLLGWGVALGRRHGHRGPGVLASGLVNVGIGFLVVLLKELVH
jgi:hypothetical protein